MKRLLYIFTTFLIITLAACSSDKNITSPEIEGSIDTTASSDNFADLGNKVWIDSNKDGIKQRPESGFAGIVVNLYKDANEDGSADGDVFKTTTTNSKGYYRFNAIDPNINYLLEVVVPENYKLSEKNNSSAQGKDYDSDINPDTGFSDSIDVQKGRYFYWFDVALQPLSSPPSNPASVGDKLWLDSNADGIKQRPESGLAGIKLNLWLDTTNNTKPDKKIATTTTNSYGNYRFDNLDSNLNYYIEIELGEYGLAPKHNPAASGKDWDSDFNSDGFSDRLELTAGKFNYWLADGALIEKPVAANEIWHRWLNSTTANYVTHAAAVTTDSADNVYMVGRSDGGLFGHNSLGLSDAYIVKYDKNGNKIWDRWLASSANEFILDIVSDKNNNIYIAGYTGDSVFGHQIVGKNDAFIVKYDKDGNKIWDRWFGSAQDDFARALAVDSANNVYLAVNTMGNLFNQNNQGSQDSFVVKYDSNGNELWYKEIANNQWNFISDLAIDVNDKIYIAGYTLGSLFRQNSQGASDGFVLIIDSSANELKTRWLGSYESDYVFAIAVDKLGGIYLAGMTAGPLFGETYNNNIDAFVIKYDLNGPMQWHKWYSTATSESINSLITDSNNNVYVAGTTESSLFGEANHGRSDAFVVKYSVSGQKQWHKWLGSQFGDYVTSLAIDSTDAIYLVGASTGSLFGESKQYGATDAFIVKYR